MSTVQKMEKREIAATFATGSTPTKFIGNAAVYNAESKFGLTSDSIEGPFKEVLLPGCFAESIASGRNITALSNHVSQPSTLLGTTQANTLRLVDTPASLQFEIDIPDTTEGKDLSVLIGRGDIKGVSLGMFVMDDDVTVDANNLQTRVIKKAILSEISLVINPAYPQTNVELRSGSMEACAMSGSNEVCSGSAEQCSCDTQTTRSFDMSYFEPYEAEVDILRGSYK